MKTYASPPPRLLLGPGPSMVHPRVLRAMSMPLVGHLDPAFLEIMEETQGAAALGVPDRQPAHHSRLGHRQRRHGGLLRQPDRAGRPGDRLRQRRVRHAHGRHRRALRCDGGARSRRRGVAHRSGATSPPRSGRPSRRSWSPSSTRRPRRGVAADGGDRQLVHEAGALAGRRHRDLAGRLPGGHRRVGHRRRLQRHAEVPELPAGAVADHVRPARPGRRSKRARPRCRAGTST